jgi:hypothetical protein
LFTVVLMRILLLSGMFLDAVPFTFAVVPSSYRSRGPRRRHRPCRGSLVVGER